MSLPDQSQKSKTLIIPIALLIGFIAPLILPALKSLQWLSSLAVHEPGHAIASLLCGQISIPTPFYTVPFSNLNNPLVIILMISLFGLLIFKGYKSNSNLMIIAGFIGVNLQLICTFLISDHSAESFILIAGLAAELVLSPLLILAYTIKLPARFNWDRNRYLFLAIGVLTYTAAVERWLQAPNDHSRVPMGAAIDFSLMSSGESGGDINRLIKNHGWNLEGIINLYWWLSIVSIIFFIAAFLMLNKNKDIDSSPML